MSLSADTALADAIQAVVDMRCHGTDAMQQEMQVRCRADPHRFAAMAAVLAALVPAERPVDELLAWTKEMD